MVKTSDLRVKDVINVSDGRRLGLISDLEVDLDSGRVTALVVPGPGRLAWLWGQGSEVVIPWENVRKIGADVILVELPAKAV